MRDVMLMQIIHSLSNVQKYPPNSILRNPFPLLFGLFNQLRDIATIRILKEDIQMLVLIIKESIVKLDDVGMLQGP